MAYATITEKVVGSTNTSERKILADDVNQIREVIQTGEKDLKTNNIALVGNTITADNGSNWIRRNNNTFQFYNGSSWQEPSTATLLTFTAGENIAARDVVYLKVSDGKIYKASSTNNDWIGVATAAITSGASGTIYPNGSLVGGFSGLTPGTWYGLNATAGTITANENYIVGLAISATQIILIKPKGDMSTRDNALYKLQGEKAINDVSATNSGVIAGSSQVLIDKFLDATGQNNTVDVLNTTSILSDTNSYTCLPNSSTGSELTQNAATSFPGGTPTKSDYRGYEFYVNKSCFITSVTKHTNCTATNVKLYKVTGEVIATATFSGNVATFSPNIFLYKAGYYRIEAGSAGANYVSPYGYSTPPYPIKNTEITFVAGSINGTTDSTSGVYNIVSLNVKLPSTSDYVNSTLQSVATTIPTGMTKVFVTPLMYEALATGDNITADVSIDNGAHYTTAVPINTWSPITSANGTQLIVKANLLTGDGSTSPKILGWRVLLE
jgi:hypothetical protein